MLESVMLRCHQVMGETSLHTRLSLMIYSFCQSTQHHLRHVGMTLANASPPQHGVQADEAPALGHQDDRYAASSRALPAIILLL